MKIEEFLERLEGVQKSSGGWIAWCPAHGDNNPSLSVSESGNRILVHCHAGCKPDEIVAAMGLKMKDLFTDSNGRGDAPNPDFADWKFASKEDERLLLSWLAGSKAGPLVIVGPHRSGKSRLLNFISQALNDGVPPCAMNALPKRKEEFIWLKMNDGHCLVIDNCWATPAGGDVIERIIQMMAAGGCGVKVRKPYSTTEIIQTRANGVLVVAAVAQSAERVLEAKKTLPHFRDAVVVRLAV